MNNGKMIFVTGSAMSGKSRFAVSQFSDLDRVQYLCTGRDMDDKTLNRIIYNEQSKDFRWENILPATANSSHLCSQNHINQSFCEHFCGVCNSVEYIRNFSVDKTPVNYKEYRCFVLDNLADWIYRKTMEKFAASVSVSEREMTAFVNELLLSINVLMSEVKSSGGTLVIISAETGFAPAPFDVTDSIYREALCTVNQRIANMADEAYFSFSGLQLRVR